MRTGGRILGQAFISAACVREGCMGDLGDSAPTLGPLEYQTRFSADVSRSGAGKPRT